MIFFPAGLYTGERLALCSDEARLHFPYVAGLVNSFGRLQLSIPLIRERAYQTFKAKPTKEQLTAWIVEYRAAFLLYVYKAPDGAVWGQLRGIPDNALPRYHTAADRKSPAPSTEDVAAFDSAYSTAKRERSEASTDFVNLSEHFGNLPQASESSETVQNISAGSGRGEDVDEDEDEEKEQIHTSPLAPVSVDQVQRNKSAKDLEAEAIVRHVFGYYLERLGRSEKQYELTDIRMKKGLAALAICRRRFPDGTKAEEALGAAVDGLLANDWNMGRSANSKKRFVDWCDHVFKNVETMEKRWEDGGFDADVHA